MTQSTSSAVYTQLFRYSDVTLQLDTNLLGEARSLRGALEHFEATCREVAFRQSVAYVADGMTAHALRAAAVDAWVRVIGHGFQVADGGGWAALLPTWLPPWILQPPYGIWPIDPGFIIGPRLPLRPPLRLPQFIWLPFPWKPPAWLKPLPWWPDYPRYEIPKQPDNIIIKLPNDRIEIPKQPDEGNPIGVAPGPVPGNKEPLSQKNPYGDEDLLKTKRYSRIAGDRPITEYDYSNKKIETIKDHIAAYGCLMTSITMLLRSQGRNITVTDLYKANYKRKTHSPIEDDLADDDDHSAGKDIVLSDLYLDYAAVKDVTSDECEAVDGKWLPAGNATETLANNIAEHGSVVIQVSTGTVDGHWIVVDAYDAATNTFTVRDPATGTLTPNVSFAAGGKYTPKGPVKYIEQRAV